MNPDFFWNLTWFEWGIYLIKVVRAREKENTLQEHEWIRWRTIVADFRNANRGKNDPVLNPSDIVKLSFDDDVKKQEAIEKVSFKEMKAQLGSKFKHGI
jgi:hypothetical protein